MQNILYFDVCALPLLLVIMTTVFLRRMTTGITNRLFIMMILFTAVSAVSDVIMEFMCREIPITDIKLFISYVAMYAYFLSRNATIVTYFFFIFAITGTWYRVRPNRIKALLLVPYGIIIITLLANTFTDIAFRIDAETGYHRGWGIFVFYSVSTLYSLIGTLYLISCRRFLSPGKLVPLISLYVFAFAAVIIQYFYPYLLIEMISTAISLIVVILFVLRPEEISDASVGSMSYEAYRVELKKILLTKQRAQIAMIKFVNANELRTYLGEDRYLTYVSHVIRQLDIMFNRELLLFDIYFEHPGTVYIKIDDVNFDVEEACKRLSVELRRNTDKTASSGERISAKACCLVIPDDLKDYDSIIRFGRDFWTQIPHDRIFANASEIISSENYKIVSNIDTILNRAISGHGFRMYYQPIYSLEKGRFVSAEALIRLNDDEFGMVSPALFIPAAEKRGVILPIGDFVLEDVHRFLSEHDLGKLGLEYVEINLSVAQCMQEDLPEKITGLRKKYGISPDMINLEITETTYEEFGNTMEVNLKILSGEGYTFSLDDYGTGYSNMQRVSKLPLKMIKLDKSLVDGMDTDDGMAIISNTVKMMRDIDKELVAEGVEDKDDLERLKSMGCHFIQGFIFSKPLPGDEFIDFLRKHNKVDAKTI